jgi:RodZ C-terminal domain
VLDRTDTTQGHPFNEEAALEELERLQAAIEQARRQRGQTVDEFDKFVRSFRNPPPAETVAAPPPVVRQTVALAPIVPAPAAPAPAVPAPVVQSPPIVEASPIAPRPSADTDESSMFDDRRSSTPESSLFDDRRSIFDEDDSPVATRPSPLDIPSSASERPRGRRVGFATLLGGLAAVAVVVIGGVMLVNRGGGNAAPPAAQSPAPTAQTPPATSAVPTRAAPARPAVPVSGIQAEIVTLRPVWVRVLVDGEKTIERELRGNDRIPVHAQRVIFVRAGDAGALRIVVNGQDQGVLGRDGEVVTRNFTSANR